MPKPPAGWAFSLSAIRRSWQTRRTAPNQKRIRDVLATNPEALPQRQTDGRCSSWRKKPATRGIRGSTALRFADEQLNGPSRAHIAEVLGIDVYLLFIDRR